MLIRIRSTFVALLVIVATAGGLHSLIGIGRHAATHDLRRIERGPDQEALRAELQARIAAAVRRESTPPLHPERAVLLVSDRSGDELQSRSFAAQIALAPLALRMIEARYEQQISSWLRSGIVVILDSLGPQREAAILERLRADGLDPVSRRVGSAYLLIAPEERP